MISRPAQLIAFAALLAGTLWMMALLERQSAPLADNGGKQASLELAPSAPAAQPIVEAWSHADRGSLRDLALDAIRLDYAFIALYSTTLAIAGFLGARFLRGGLARFGPWIGYGMWFAGLCDVLENLGMTAELGGHYAVAPLVCVASATKWLLVLAGLAYGAATLAAMAVRWRRLIAWACGA